MTRVTPELIASLRVAEQGTSVGPWAVMPLDDTFAVYPDGGPGRATFGTAHVYRPEDAAFIVFARNYWAILLDEIEGLRRDLTETQNSVVELAEEIEFLRGNKKVSRD